jgi:DNA-binding LacI/PurR family transcriptional regulator
VDSLRPTQKDVARTAGVTQATVSLALRNHPEVSAKTRTRIQAIAQRLGYAPDPYLSGLSAYRKTRRPAKFQASLAWLSNYPAGESWKNFPAFRGYFEGATARARELGYQLEEFRLHTPGMTCARMENILAARNIAGVLVAPQPRAGMKLEFDFGRFSAVTLGYTLAEPQLHVTTLHMFRSMETAFRRLLALGYRRPRLALAIESDRRADRQWSAAFWTEQQSLPATRRVPLLLGQPLERKSFLAWFKQHRPDVIVAIWPEVLAWLVEEGITVPETVGLALLTVPDGGVLYSGIWENPQVIGAKAVEFLVDLTHRGERGRPHVPLTMLVAGTWVEGKTVRAQK